MSKQKKNQQKNLSLKERLAKHWGNRNWDLFVALFLRDREASMRTPWAARWNDALYNSLTQALFTDRNPANAEATLAVIDAERSSFGIEASLENCAAVASDFLKARKNAFLKELSPLRAEGGLPSVYAKLREGLAPLTPAAKGRKADKAKYKGAAAETAGKFAAQCAKLGRAKTITPYTTWLKQAEQLLNMAKGTENEPAFRAIQAIASLTRELLRAGKINSLRDPRRIISSYFFGRLPQGQTHSAVKAMWEFFCRTGERKFGSEWGDAARVAQLDFMDDENQRALKTLYLQVRSAENRRHETILADILRDSSAWTEQELYVLGAMFVTLFKPAPQLDMCGPIVTQFINTFGALARIGSKWRPEAPWTEAVQESYDSVLYSLPAEFVSFVLPRIPYPAVSPFGLVILALKDAKYLKAIERNVSARLPLNLKEESVKELADYMAHNTPPRWTMQVLNSLMNPEGRIGLLTSLGRTMLAQSGRDAYTAVPPSRQAWVKFSQSGLPEEMAAVLPPDNFVGCFCRLCSDMPPCHISADPSKIDAFLASLPLPDDRNEFSDVFMLFLLTWPDTDPQVIVRLFEKSSLFLYKQFRLGGGLNWTNFVKQIGKMPNKANRKALARGILQLLAKDGGKKYGALLSKAIETLERYGNEKLPQKTGSVRSKVEQTSKNNQGLLPF